MSRSGGRGGFRGGGGQRRGGAYGQYGNQGLAQGGSGAFTLDDEEDQRERTGMTLAGGRGQSMAPGFEWLENNRPRANLSVLHVAEPSAAQTLRERERFVAINNGMVPDVVFIEPDLGALVARAINFRTRQDARANRAVPTAELYRGSAARARDNQQQIEGTAQQRQMGRGQGGANEDWNQLRQEQERQGRAGPGGLGVARGRGNGGGGFYSQNRAGHQVHRGGNGGGGGGYRARAQGNGGSSGVGPRNEPIRQRPAAAPPAQTPRAPGSRTQANADPDAAVGIECKVCYKRDHMEMDCAKGSVLGADSTYCCVHRGRIYEIGTDQCKGSLDECWATLTENVRMTFDDIITMVFQWIVAHRSSRPEPRCIGWEWHWATCVATYMETNPNVEVTAEMLPIRRSEYRERQDPTEGHLALAWANFSFKHLARSKTIFQDVYWDTKGDRAALIKKLRKYVDSEEGQYIPPSSKAKNGAEADASPEPEPAPEPDVAPKPEPAP